MLECKVLLEGCYLRVCPLLLDLSKYLEQWGPESLSLGRHTHGLRTCQTEVPYCAIVEWSSPGPCYLLKVLHLQWGVEV